MNYLLVILIAFWFSPANAEESPSNQTEASQAERILVFPPHFGSFVQGRLEDAAGNDRFDCVATVKSKNSNAVMNISQSGMVGTPCAKVVAYLKSSGTAYRHYLGIPLNSTLSVRGTVPDSHISNIRCKKETYDQVCR